MGFVGYLIQLQLVEFIFKICTLSRIKLWLSLDAVTMGRHGKGLAQGGADGGLERRTCATDLRAYRSRTARTSLIRLDTPLLPFEVMDRVILYYGIFCLHLVA